MYFHLFHEYFAWESREGIILTNQVEAKSVMENLITGEIRRLVQDADVYVFALYDPDEPNGDPLEYRCHKRQEPLGTIDIDVNFDFEGVGIWYICTRSGESFSVRKILVRIRGGHFVDGQVGTFEGFWDEFPKYVSEDKWVRSLQSPPPANSQVDYRASV